MRRAWARAAFGPSACNLVFPPDARLVLEPDFYLAWIDAVFLRNFFQTRGEFF